MAVQLFGYLLAGGVLLSSLLMLALGGRFQQVERAAYAGARRPLWFWALSAIVVALYLIALVSFVAGPRTWGGALRPRRPGVGLTTPGSLVTGGGALAAGPGAAGVERVL